MECMNPNKTFPTFTGERITNKSPADPSSLLHCKHLHFQWMLTEVPQSSNSKVTSMDSDSQGMQLKGHVCVSDHITLFIGNVLGQKTFR